MTTFARIRANVELMAEKGAPPEHINDYLHSEGLTSHQFKARMDGVKEAEGIGNLANTALKYSAASGPANFADMIPNALTNVANLGIANYGIAKQELPTFAQKILKALPMTAPIMALGGAKDLYDQKVNGAAENDLPSPIPHDALSGFSKLGKYLGVINDEYAPTDLTGKMVDFGTQAITGGGVNPAAIARFASKGNVPSIVRDVLAAGISGAGAGAGASLAGNVNTGNESVDNALKIAASLLGGMAGAPVAMRGNAADRAKAILKNTTPEQLKQADAIQRLSHSTDVNSPLVGYEAIQSATGMNPKMQTIQRLIEQSDAGVKTTTPIMQQRPGKNAALLEKVAGALAPINDRPDTLAATLRAAAESGIETARKAGNAQAAPYYGNSSNNPSVKVPSSAWNSAVSDPGIVEALQTVKKNPFSGLQNATEGSVQWLDAAKKWLDAQSQVVGANRYEASNQSGAAKRIVDAVDPVVPDYGKARAIVAQNMRESVNPLQEGQVGKLAQGDGFKAQLDNLLPHDAPDVTPSVIKNTARVINAENPDILRQFLANGLRYKFNEVAGGGINSNPMGGYQFAKNIADNPMQKQNLIAAIIGSGADAAPMQTALEMFRAQGFKPPVNSATVSNASEMAAITPTTNPFTNSFKALAQVIPQAIDKWRNGAALEDLAKAGVGPDAIPQIEALARVNGMHDPMKQQMLINLLLSNQPSQ